MNPRNNPMHRRPSSRLLAVAAAAQAPIASRPVEPTTTEQPVSNLDEMTK